MCGSGRAVADYYIFTTGKKSVHLEARALVCGGCIYIQNISPCAYMHMNTVLMHVAGYCLHIDIIHVHVHEI